MASQEHPSGNYDPVKPETVKDILEKVVPEEDKASQVSCCIGAGSSAERVSSPAPTSLLLWTSSGVISAPQNKYDEVYPGIFLGEAYLSKEKDELKRLGITHILNAAQGTKCKFAQIDTNEDTYADLGIQFYGITALDTPKCNLGKYFKPAAEFIHNALEEKGRIFVHCFQGISRSASLVLAYLMIYQKIPLPEAVTLVRKKRAIHPNDGFVKQLCRLHNEIFCVEPAEGDGNNSGTAT